MFKELKFWLRLHLFSSLIYWWNTKARPRFAPHYWCKFYDCTTKKAAIGWYVLDRKGKMIPWVHHRDGRIICLYENMITKIS